VDLAVFALSGLAFIHLFTGVNPDGVYEWGRQSFVFTYEGVFPHASEYLLVQITWPLLRMVAGDFGYYLYHRVMHYFNSLWFFHAAHHSARNLNFLTAYRMHPVDAFVSNLILGIVGGIWAMITIFLFGKNFITLYIYGFVYYMPLRAVIANLRHSNVFMTFPGWLGKFFNSPAHHQMHHSKQPEFSHINYSNDFAFIDGMFGTLYVPSEKDHKKLIIGINEEEHGLDGGSFLSFLLAPFRNLFNYWKMKILSKNLPVWKRVLPKRLFEKEYEYTETEVRKIS
jgi:sterol desaturase/sphingolipid hydroxylase (fatty acid hydroxylase superfamily)